MRKFSSLLLLITSSFGFVSLANKKPTFVVYPTQEKIIFSICFSANGKSLYVADGNSIKRFSTDDQKLLSTFSGGHRNTILGIDLSIDSTLLVSGGKDSAIVVWDVKTNQMLKRLTYHKGIITSVHLSADNRYLISGGTDKKVCLYDLQNNELISTFSDHTDDVTSVKISPDGKTLVSSGADGLINFYGTEDKKLLSSVRDRKRWTREVSFNSRGDKLISCGDNGDVIIWNAIDPRSVKMIRKSRVSLRRLHSVSFFKNDNIYLAGGLNGTIKIRMAKGNYKFKTSKPVNAVSFKPRNDEKFEVAVATWGMGVIQVEGINMNYKKMEPSRL